MGIVKPTSVSVRDVISGESARGWRPLLALGNNSTVESVPHTSSLPDPEATEPLRTISLSCAIHWPVNSDSKGSTEFYAWSFPLSFRVWVCIAHMWRSEDSLLYQMLVTFHLLFETGSLVVHQIFEHSWPISTKDLPVPISRLPSLGLQTYVTTPAFYHTVWGSKQTQVLNGKASTLLTERLLQVMAGLLRVIRTKFGSSCLHSVA